MKNIYYTLVCSCVIITLGLKAQNDSSASKSPFGSEVLYVGDAVSNLSGGIKKGSCYLGMANLNLSFDFEKAKLWKGGSFFMHAANTHGTSPSADFLGDIQTASNIDAGNHTYIQELWFRQSFDKFEFTFGLQDMNVEMANTESGALYLNSSFGILPTISGNISAPIFPLTTLGLTSKWQINENSSWLVALYDGCPTEFDNNPFNLKWQFNSGDGILAITEFHQSLNINSLPGTYKISVFSYNHIAEKILNKEVPEDVNHTISGINFFADQRLWEKNKRSLNVFVQLGNTPSNNISNNYYFGGGLNYNGLFSKEGTDALGLAVAHVHLKENDGTETAIELTYFNQISKNIFIQPDFQYIFNPSGTGEKLNNAFATILRFGLSF